MSANFRRACALSASGIALSFLLSAQAQAQDTGDGAASTQGQSQIIVTGSRIVRNGAEQPTPVTVVSAEELTATSTNLSEGLATLPQLASSANDQDTQNLGPVRTLDLRSLGANRTLVLLDGRRLTPATTGSAPNINSLPHALVQRVDIITGGASAAYGSDAVAGVVNFILDTNFEGLKGKIQGGLTEAGDAENYTLSLTAGASFGADDRGHIVASGEYYRNDGTWTHNRDWERNDYMVLRNPTINAGNPSTPDNPDLLIRPFSGLSRPPGGVVTSGPLQGLAFGSGDSTYQFDFGTLQSGTYQEGGDYNNRHDFTPFTDSNSRWSAFVHVGYELTDSLNFFAEAMLSEVKGTDRTYNNVLDMPIYSGNAFLPADVQQQMDDLGLASITVGKSFDDLHWDPSREISRGGQSILDDSTSSEDFTVGLDGDFSMGDRPFSWNVYYQHGKSTYDRHVPNMPIPILIAEAIDAVVVTPENVGASGLPIGSVVCRSSLTYPTNGCLPVDWLGPNENNSVDAVQGMFRDNWFAQTTNQDAAAVNLQGELFDNWAGTVSVAIGAEWRRIRSDVETDLTSQLYPLDFYAEHPGVRGVPSRYLSNANRGPYLFGNYQPVSGSYNVKEVYGEILVPLVRRQNIWHNSRRRFAECGPRLGVDVKRRACGVASADIRVSVV